MTMDRRAFLRQASGVVSLGLLTGEAALEWLARLMHKRKSFPSADIPVLTEFELIEERDYLNSATSGWYYPHSETAEKMSWLYVGKDKPVFASGLVWGGDEVYEVGRDGSYHR